ncbi:hypothetical protein FIBSPDRAFT_831962 [Athelia psychrophila]|uniref:Uncharacterized protein n=1 Tax=Athelia psychrophila TaxID=1759441 RepID=A0A166F1P4_9AGAM|nr:hypothetical protein FIBSPDRAFT_831962 [Fibularhizoctonia sp. CBS 109695]
MIREERELQQEIKDLRKREHTRLHEPEKSLSLGAFDNTVDQVSEAQVKSHGRVSVDGINDSVDTIAHNIHHPIRSPYEEPPSNLEPLFQDAFCSSALSEDSRGLLLDAAIHHIIVQALHSMCFQGKVSTYYLENTHILEYVYEEIAASEPWSASQRWRSMSASTFMKLLDPSDWDSYVNSASQQIITTTAWAFEMPVSAFQSLGRRLEENIAGVFQSAHELSVVLKRDILSARLSVVVGPEPKSQFDSSRVWPEMKSERQDRVLGYYGLGLQVERREGEKHFLTLPMVITESLTREVKRNG